MYWARWYLFITNHLLQVKSESFFYLEAIFKCTYWICFYMFLIVLQMDSHGFKLLSPKWVYGNQTHIEEDEPSALLVAQGKLFCFLVVVFSTMASRYRNQWISESIWWKGAGDIKRNKEFARIKLRTCATLSHVSCLLSNHYYQLLVLLMLRLYKLS